METKKEKQHDKFLSIFLHVNSDLCFYLANHVDKNIKKKKRGNTEQEKNVDGEMTKAKETEKSGERIGFHAKRQ